MSTEQLTPRAIVEELDRYIVGQRAAKKAVAIALRNRYRRHCLPEAMRDEITPKNILMIGPTGVGKTEIARRLARLVQAPFIKVEATKFTEVGYVGRDVESMVRDLVEMAIRMIKAEKLEDVQQAAVREANERLLEHLVPQPKPTRPGINPFEMIFGGSANTPTTQELDPAIREKRAIIREKLKRLELEDDWVEVEIEDHAQPLGGFMNQGGMDDMGMNLQNMLGQMLPRIKKKKRVKVKEAREILAVQEAQKLIDMEAVQRLAVERAEQSGIIFLDEIDKIAQREGGQGPDVSRGGVQRDILPIVEGSTVMTKYGPVKTDHILFIAAGAFHVSKPSDLIPELQGRFPLRVELEALSQEDFQRILTEPENSLLKQYVALLSTENLHLEFTEDGIEAMASIAFRVNGQTENIGARRLHTILEKVLEEISFEAPEWKEPKVVIDKHYVEKRLNDIVEKEDLSRYIL
ncbi:ATP-dependent protease ATPase subunit HslU [Heliophilum fasciatum]|uniref:ATP-dependent protease ATPase subunit HslU n=1 Tax=Heliophilum fasciatum TaxID=35700 RepID=A0A4R2RKQ7_9FIRM|nr:ATP-dependent protease ATPase subunit HslU [Heliophilum fasciatum]MCW2277950.1 ATP-dependent HslUV protease ATP-binding subunit HslU [Heliophilum fasciatum]TCP64480.1 ATP-dependent HslUV protease ATP-binding subunit HslU [Heliophilum fasciatum]